MWYLYDRIETVEVVERFKVRVTFNTGRVVVYDVGKDIETQEFYRPLRDIPGLFETVHVCESHGFIAWEHQSLSERIDIPDDILIYRGTEETPAAPQYAFCEGMVTEIIRLRKEQGLTQAALGEKAGIKQQVIARIETGQAMPKLDTLGKLFHALNVKLTAVAA